MNRRSGSAVVRPGRQQPPWRLAWLLACAVLLLWAQQLLLGHVHAAEHAAPDDAGVHVCVLCVGQAAGHDQLAPPRRGMAVAGPAGPGSAAPARQIDGHALQACPRPWQARAPPAGRPTA